MGAAIIHNQSMASALVELSRGSDAARVLAFDGDLDEAMHVQLAGLDIQLAEGEELGGWKVGLTSGSGRDLLGAGVRPFGYVLRAGIVATGSVISPPAIGPARIEPELCLTLGSNLAGADLPLEMVRQSVATVGAGFEINESRLPAGSPAIVAVADRLGGWGIVVGTGQAPVPGRRLTDITVETYLDDVLVSASTPGKTMDDPFLSLSRLCSGLARYGRGLRAGDHVITGAFSNHAVTGPGRWRAVFRTIGEVSVVLA
jgi:2-keto-4-pentenoate hydratase